MLTIKDLYDSNCWAMKTPKGNMTKKGERITVNNCSKENLYKAKEVYSQIYNKSGKLIKGYGIAYCPIPDYETAVMEIRDCVEKEGYITAWARAILAKSQAYAEKGTSRIYIYGTLNNDIPEIKDKNIIVHTQDYFTYHTSINIGPAKNIPDLMPLIEFINENYVERDIIKKYAEGISERTLVQYIVKNYEKYPEAMEEALKKTWANI